MGAKSADYLLKRSCDSVVYFLITNDGLLFYFFYLSGLLHYFALSKKYKIKTITYGWSKLAHSLNNYEPKAVTDLSAIVLRLAGQFWWG